jgi:hypothetical protein
MTDSITLYLHFPCFDGVVSAVLASEYLARKRGWQTREIVPVNYALQAQWATMALAERAVVVDFLYHPKAFFWADHHPTSFATEELKTGYLERRSPDILYDPKAISCAEVLWRRVYRQLRDARFREMVDWARRIDGARYENVEEAVWGNAPALRINQSLMTDSSPEYCRFLVEALREKTLAEVAECDRVRGQYEKTKKATERGQELFQSKCRIEGDGVVVFQLPRRSSKMLVSRYAPYLAYPKARYSVGILPQEVGSKITAMRNPWRRFRSLPLGQIFHAYGGGGHQRVASVLVKDARKARSVLSAIVERIQGRKQTGRTGA